MAGEDRVMAAFFEPLCQTIDLGGFTGTVEAFEGDEKTARHGLDVNTRIRGETMLHRLCYKSLNPEAALGLRPSKGTCFGKGKTDESL